MMPLFNDGSVVCDLSSTEKYAAIHELITRADVFKKIVNPSQFEEIVVKREKKLSTGLGHGVAFAHGKTETVDGLYVALGISKDGIEYQSFDGKPVHLLFVVANPPDGHAEYLKLISALSKLIRDDAFKEKVLAIRNNVMLEKLFKTSLEQLQMKC